MQSIMDRRREMAMFKSRKNNQIDDNAEPYAHLQTITKGSV